MKQLLLAVLAMVFVAVMVSMAAAATVNCVPPCPACPPVYVTCDCSQTELPGFWEMNVNGVEWCGRVTIIGSGIMIERNDGERTYGYVNKIKRMHMVETCE
jgi:opacity protein-like surface antigen